MPKSLAEQPRARVYPQPDGRVLFVPSPEMWLVHEASTPAAICKRAGLGPTVSKQWIGRLGRERPWLKEWLYTPHVLLPAEAGDFEPIKGMYDFRRKAGIEVTFRDAGVTFSMLAFWDRTMAGFDWFRPWLLRGQSPPARVTVVPLATARRCAKMWHVGTVCRLAGIHSASFTWWIGRGGLVRELTWLKWLFGAPPPTGHFVVSTNLQRLRREMGQEAIIRHLGISQQTVWTWKNGKRTAAPYQAILNGDDLAGAEGWPSLTEETKRNMLLFKKAVSIAECLRRAKMPLATYQAALRDAKVCGVKDELLNYLRMEGSYRSRPSGGLVAPHFFLPTPDMLRFRVAAAKLAAKYRPPTAQHLPGVDDWFLDCVRPKPVRGRRAGEHLVRTHNSVNGRQLAEAQIAVRKKPEPRVPAQPQQDRLTLDQGTLTITLDGETFAGVDPTAFRLFEAINKGKAVPVSGRELRRLPAMSGKNVSRELEKLPANLQSVIRTKPGSGRWIELPPPPGQ